MKGRQIFFLNSSFRAEILELETMVLGSLIEGASLIPSPLGVFFLLGLQILPLNLSFYSLQGSHLGITPAGEIDREGCVWFLYLPLSTWPVFISLGSIQKGGCDDTGRDSRNEGWCLEKAGNRGDLKEMEQKLVRLQEHCGARSTVF